MSNPTLRAKMVVQSVLRHADHDGGIEFEAINLTAFNGTEGDNEDWSRFTPTASLDMTITNPSAMGKILPGQEYYVDLVPA